MPNIPFFWPLVRVPHERHNDVTLCDVNEKVFKVVKSVYFVLRYLTSLAHHHTIIYFMNFLAFSVFFYKIKVAGRFYYVNEFNSNNKVFNQYIFDKKYRKKISYFYIILWYIVLGLEAFPQKFSKR
jgi:hypothetical protein